MRFKVGDIGLESLDWDWRVNNIIKSRENQGQERMCKKSYVTMECHRKNYKIYISDILRVHSLLKKPRPGPPPYIEAFSPKEIDKSTNLELDSFPLL
jgi:hypothetical protein